MTTWQETVISNKQLEENIRQDYDDFSIKSQTGEIEDILIWTREAQAELSFKAGEAVARKEDEVLAIEVRQYHYEKMKEAKEYARQQGRQEVVEWLNEDCDCPKREVAKETVDKRRIGCWKCKAKLKEIV